MENTEFLKSEMMDEVLDFSELSVIVGGAKDKPPIQVGCFSAGSGGCTYED